MILRGGETGVNAEMADTVLCAYLVVFVQLRGVGGRGELFPPFVMYGQVR